MISFNIFGHKDAVSARKGFAFLKTDMHSHLVPAIDDGSDSLETSLLLLEGLIALGYEKVITTPHVRPEHFPNSSHDIRSGFDKVKKAASRAGLGIELSCAAEYFVGHDFSGRIETGDLLTFGGNKVLIELSTFSPPPNLFETIFQLKVKGYQPVLAHPARYVYFKEIEDFQRFKEAGCFLQLNILSLTGHYGKHVKTLAFRLLKGGLVDLLGTDLHHQRHLKSLHAVEKDRSLMRLLRGTKFLNTDL